MNKSVLASQKISEPDSLRDAIKHTVSQLNHEQMLGTFEQVINLDDHGLIGMKTTVDQNRVTPLKQMKHILDAFRAS